MRRSRLKPPQSRGAAREATAIIANARKILTPNGIERLEKVRIGGIEQWISIRGVDRRNPVLVVIHGGPGYVDMPMSWWFGRGWEEYFTVVYWDQRAAGKTYLLSDPEAIRPTLTVDRIVLMPRNWWPGCANTCTRTRFSYWDTPGAATLAF